MRTFSRVIVALWLGSMSGYGPGCGRPQPVQAADRPAESAVIEAVGKTHPAPGRLGKIAPTVLHPVVEVLVKPGDRVKKDQPLVKLDDDEPRADVRAKKAAVEELRASLARLKAQPREHEWAEARATLDSARTLARTARESFTRLEPLMQKGAISERRYHEAQGELKRSEAEERAAGARLERLLKQPWKLEIAELEARVAAAVATAQAAEAELEHYTVNAPIGGVVSTLEVSPGQVSKPGWAVWGEILDLREIDVHCELTPQQADAVSVGQTATVTAEWHPGVQWRGQVAFVGIAADPRTGRVPVWVRVPNPDGRLRCYVEVKAQLATR
jgi:multidrug resistance efflux pump